MPPTGRDAPPAPRAPRQPTVLRHGADERVDDWYWLRDRDNPDVLRYLEAENDYQHAGLAHTEELRERIFEEIRSRVQESDTSAPVARDQWEYFSRTITGREYRVHCRRPRGTVGLPDPDAAPGAVAGEEVLLDENERADGHDYFALRGFAISPDHRHLAFSTDVTGGERAQLRFRDLTATIDLADEIPDTYYGLAWANDNTTVFYVRPDHAMRPFQVWRHTLGDPVEHDTLVYEEADERFYVGLDRTRSGRYVLIAAESKITTEVHVVDCDELGAPSQLFAARQEGVEYSIEHHHGREHGDRFFVVTNADGAENFKLMVTGWPAAEPSTWKELVPHREDVRLEAVDAFAAHIVVSERAAALPRLRVQRVSDGDEHEIEMTDEVYSTWVGPNAEFESTTLRYGYTSLVVPSRDVDYDLDTRLTTVAKEQPVPGYDPSRYETWREWASAPDGARVPISVVQPRDTPRDGSAPLLLYGYGSYEISIDPVFSVSRVSLLERGVGYAIAHVRGGGELGRAWYEDGKLDRKKHTFTDFIACSEHLVAISATAPERLVARGGSAGGLLMGAVANMRPDLFRAMVAEVPFVDCLTTMLDDQLPLTITEWEEWGNPVISEEMYDYMKSYSPYDNVRDQAYPSLLVTAGLNDPRVQYWEPAKWVAKLRETETATAPIFLKTELGAGHHGPSGRYESWRDEAFVLAFILDQVSISR